MLNRNNLSGLLLAAFLVWMFHSMVAHHHHGAEICFNTHHCQEAGCSTGEIPGAACHQHDHSGDEEGCILRQVTFLPVKQIKTTGEQVPAKKVAVVFPFAVVPDVEHPASAEGLQKWKSRSGSPPLSPGSLYAPCGLRAPPLV